MRWLALVVFLCTPAVLAAPTPTKKHTSKKRTKRTPAPEKASAPDVPAAPDADRPPAVRDDDLPPPRSSKPERRETTSSPEPARPPAPSKPESARGPFGTRRETSAKIGYALAFGGGGFYGGGLNRGPLATVQLSIVPPFWEGRLVFDAELDWRFTRFLSNAGDLGRVTSTLHAAPLYAAARLNVLRIPHFAIDLRAGVGPLFALQHLSTTFSSPSVRTALGWELIGGVQLRVPLSAVELFLDGRVGLGEAYIPFVVGRATGLQGVFGMRYALP